MTRPSRRGAFLALMGAVFVLIGYSYLTITPVERPAVKHALRLVTDHVSLTGLGVLWVLAGCLAIADGMRAGVRSVVGFTAAIVMPTAWSVIYLGAWLDNDLPRGWVSAALFAAIAGAVGMVAGMADLSELRRRR